MRSFLPIPFTVKNTVISLNFLAFPQNFHTRKLGEITAFFTVIYSVINEAIQSGDLSSCLKWADVTPILKKGLRCQVDIYRCQHSSKFMEII